jgi:ABC-type transporter Mla subunit MlaD
MWKYSVHFYSLLLGLPLYENDPRAPPRLQDLVPLNKAYDEIKSNLVNTIGAHSFLFGYKDAFEKLTGIRLGGMSSEERNRRIAEFWADYEIVDPRTKIDQLYVALATTVGRFQSRGTEIDAIVNLVTTQCSQPIPKQYGMISLSSIHSVASTLGDNLRKLNEILNELGEFSLEFASIIQDSARILPMAKQRIREQKNQAQHILKCTEETVKATSSVTFALGTASEAFSNTLNKWLANLQNYLGKAPPNKMEIQALVQQISQDYTDVKNWLVTSSKTSQQIMQNLQKLRQSLDDLRQEILKIQ